MEYAVVDIETTGGYASGSGITEIAILIHNGEKVIERLQTLVNPLKPIPRYIQALTGITDEMVCNSPDFGKLAEQVYNILEGRIFVAHNVNFDYSFIKYHLEKAGFSYNAQRLCTVRLSRKLRPGLPSYSLGKLCDALRIPLMDRHRAVGDANATALLFSSLLKWDTEGHISRMLVVKSKEQQLPPNLPREIFEKLPGCSGVYYFKNQNGKVIYVGKAKNIRKRVASHFTGHNPNPQRQHFLRNIYSIDFEPCGTELLAFLFEAIEVKRLWPAFNKAMKQREPKFALYSYEDQGGYLRLSIGNHKKHLSCVQTFNLKTEAVNLVMKLIREFRLRPDLCGFKLLVHDHDSTTTQVSESAAETLSPFDYNIRVKNALHFLTTSLPTFGIIDNGRSSSERSCIWVENGCLYGFGYVDQHSDLKSPSKLKESISRYTGNHYMMQLIYSYAQKYPQKVLRIDSENSCVPKC